MARPKISTKHIQINKANQVVVVATSVAAVVLVFGFFVGRALVQRQVHQNRVIKEKSIAKQQLEANIEAKKQLETAYLAFTATERNLLGGASTPQATGEKDGDNARLVLDALPSKYDFPALATSMEKLLVSNGYEVDNITGDDDEVAQSSVEPQANPEPVEIPISFSVATPYDKAQPLFGLFERSIRPFKVKSLEISSDSNQLRISMDALTYYQPEKSVSITKKTIK